MVVLTYISLKGVGLGFNHGRIWGRGLRVQSPQMIFFTIQKLKIYKTIKYNVMSWANQNPPPKAKTLSFYGYAPGLTPMLML